jgi:hypothetical protein
MKKLIGICAVLVLVQAGLWVWSHVANNRSTSSQAGKGFLLKINTAEVNALVLEDGEGHTLQLIKEKDQWQLPALASFPADAVRVQGLIDRLAGEQRGWPEATTLEAAKRFKVASERFERKLTLRNNSTDLGVVYFGSSPGLRKTYVRVDGSQEIQALALASHELEMRADAWIDTRVLQLKVEQVMRVTLPGLQLERHQEGLQPTDLAADEEIVPARRDALMKRLANLAISAVLGKEIKPEYGQATPTLRYSVELEGGTSIEYVFALPPAKAEAKAVKGQMPELPSYVLKVSNREQLFRVDGWQVEEIKKVNRAGLVQKKGKGQTGGETPQ